jgi:stearoyl-CoA 9-desaturase NADPH oxidoreductase
MTAPSATVGAGEAPSGPRLRRGFWGAAGWLTTPLLPQDYLGLLNPLWSGRELRGRVVTVQPETVDATTIVIRPGTGWAGHRAGQHVGVGVEVDGVRRWRSYSLSAPPGRRDGRISITVKAVQDGLVSPYLAHRIVPGAILSLRKAEGGFTLPPTLPTRLLFLTAGSGITPVMAMLRSLSAQAEMPDVVVLHSAPTRDDVIFGTELRELAAQRPGLRLYEQHTRAGAEGGRFTLARLPEICADWSERETWACGPATMLDDVQRRWQEAGIADRLRVEQFRAVIATSGGVGGRVRFTKSRLEADTDGEAPLLAVGEDAGVLMPSGCRMGICFSCVARLSCGRVRDLRTGREHGEPGELIQTCVSAAAGALEIDL